MFVWLVCETKGVGTYRVFHLDSLILLGLCLDLRQDLFEVRVGQLVVLSICELREHGLASVALGTRWRRIARVGEDALVLGACRGEEP